MIKGTVQLEIRPPVFSSYEPTWVTDHFVKIFLILEKILPSYSNFKFEKTDFTVFKPRGVKQKLKPYFFLYAKCSYLLVK